MSSAPGDLSRFFRTAQPLFDIYRELLIECQQTAVRFSLWANLVSEPDQSVGWFSSLVETNLAADSQWLDECLSPPMSLVLKCIRAGQGRYLPYSAMLHGLVRGISSVAEKQLIKLFMDSVRKADGLVRKNDVIYTPKLNLQLVFGKDARFSSSQSKTRLSRPDNPTPDFRLANSRYFELFDVYLDFQNSEAVDELLKKSLHFGIAVGDPGLVFPRDYRSVEEWQAQPPVVNCFGIRPANQDQLERIRRILQHAMNSSVGIVVLPELSAGPEMVADIEGWVNQYARQTSLIVPGSFHDLAERQHELLGWWILPPTVRRFSHRKFRPGKTAGYAEFLGPRDGSGYVERPTIRVHCGLSGLRITTLICADALGPEIQEILSCLGVNLVVAPAMSETFGVFNGLATNLADTTQGITVVANTPADLESPSAMIRFPLRDSREFWIGRTFQDPPPRILLTEGRSTSWRILKNGQEDRDFATNRSVPSVCAFFWPDFRCNWHELTAE